MKGHVPTPPAVVDAMVEKLFRERRPKSTDVVLDPGCGDGPFIDGVLRYCKAHKLKSPRIVGIELNPAHLKEARAKFAGNSRVDLLQQDYLDAPVERVSYVIGNPPYVSIGGLDDQEKKRYRAAFETAVGRFDLYLLFFERSIKNLKHGGRLVFITPEKFEYVHTAEPLRRMLSCLTIEELHHIDEETFPGLVTYPTITTVTRATPAKNHRTCIVNRDGSATKIALPTDGRAWSGALQGSNAEYLGTVLQDVCVRVSCGIATGTDEVFVQRAAGLSRGLGEFAYPTISGRQLGASGITEADEVVGTNDVMLVPYARDGSLLPEAKLGALGRYLNEPEVIAKLRERTHVADRGRAYYRFHDNAPLNEILRPKIICKDIAPVPKFWADRKGTIVPRHSAYYIVPSDPAILDQLVSYLNGPIAQAWLIAHAQRAANGYYRLQSSVMKRLPVPETLATSALSSKKARRSGKVNSTLQSLLPA